MLLFTCTATPLRIAFEDSVNMEIDIAWAIIDNFVDLCFLIDIVLNFFMAYYNDEFKLVDDRKLIRKKYLTTWFTIDVVAILPIDYILRTGEYN